MKKPCVLLSGKSVSRDAALIVALQKSAEVISNPDNDSIEEILESKKADVIIMEVNPGEAEIVRQIKDRYPETEIIIINGGRELMAAAFQYGASDAYRKPYKNVMLVERVETLLGCQ